MSDMHGPVERIVFTGLSCWLKGAYLNAGLIDQLKRDNRKGWTRDNFRRMWYESVENLLKANFKHCTK